MENCCENLEKCKFFEVYKHDTSKQLSLRGFAKMYCQGNKQSQCIRKKLSKDLGKIFVPSNMMPNGHPLQGTTCDNWGKNVILDLAAMDIPFFKYKARKYIIS